jgi:DNA-binding CsgD family transcriptional regulator
MPVSEKTDRNHQILTWREQGKTYEQIAELCDISVERVTYICRRANARSANGTSHRPVGEAEKST